MAIKISGVTIIDDSRNIVSGAAATFTSNVTIGGTLTYEDVTNIDSIGIITAREGISIPNLKGINLGDSNELNIINSNNNAFIQHSGSGYLFIHGNDIALRSQSQKNYIVCDADNDVELYFNNSPKFKTTNTGVEVIHAGGGVLDVTTINATDGDYAGIVTAQGFVGGGINTNTVSSFKDLQVLGGINVNGVATATAFSGDGSNLTNLPVSSFFTNTDVGIHTLAKVGIGTTNPIAQLDVNVGTSVTALNIEGSEGQLFSVTNNLSSGSIFAVNDITGLPSLDVNADGTIQLAPRGAGELVGIGTTVPTSKLHVVGDTLVTGVSTFSGNVSFGSSALFGDNDKIMLGDNDKFQIFKSGSHARITNNYSGGSFLILGSGNGVLLQSDAGHNLIRAIVGGKVELYNASTKKAETYSGGFNVIGNVVSDGLIVDGHSELDNINVSGISTFSDDVNLSNDKKVKYGNMGFQIYQNTSGSNNAVIEQSASGQFLRLVTNGGQLSVEADYVQFRNSANTTTTAQFDADGATNLFHNSNPKFLTTSTGAEVVGILTATSIKTPKYDGDADRNIIMGCCAGIAITDTVTDACRNVIIGCSAGRKVCTGFNAVIIGACAGHELTNTGSNILMGEFAACKMCCGFNNVVIGKRAGMGLTGRTSCADLSLGANSNVFIGSYTGNCTRKECNTFVGPLAGQFNSTGQHNTFIGVNAGRGPSSSAATNTGYANVYLGSGAGINARGGNYNIAIGRNTGTAISTGGNNILMGCGAGLSQISGFNNILVGNLAGGCVTTGAQNIFIGQQAGRKNISGGLKIAIGDNAGEFGMGDSANGGLAIGFCALRCDTCGIGNVAIGNGAGSKLTCGQNIFMGQGTGVKATAAHGNTFLGNYVGGCFTTGQRNTFVGCQAGFGHTVGTFNVMLGACSGPRNCGAVGECNIFIGGYTASAMCCGLANVLIGTHAGQCIRNAFCNIFLGRKSGLGQTSGCFNFYVGNHAGPSTCGASGSDNIGLGRNTMRIGGGAAQRNIAIGVQAGYCVTGNYNILFGCGAGELITSGSRNIIIGCGVDAPSATGNRQLAIGEGTCRWIVGDSSFNVTLAGIVTATAAGSILANDAEITSVSPKLKINQSGTSELTSVYNNNAASLVISDTIHGAQIVLRGLSPKLIFDQSAGGNGSIYYDSQCLKFYQGMPTGTSVEKVRFNGGGINVSGAVTATAFIGDGSQLTGISGGGGGGSGFFAQTDVGIHTLSKVGIGTTNPIAQLDVNVGSSVTAFNVAGSEGQLFSVTNNLTSGSIFEVNDVSGMPSIDVNADGTIQLAPHGTGELVGIGTTVPTSKLHVVGDTLVTGVGTFHAIKSTAESFLIHNTADRILMKGSNRIDLADNRVRFQSRDQSTILLDAVAGSSGFVNLYHDNDIRLSTNSTGIQVNNGSADINLRSGTSSATGQGQLTFENVDGNGNPRDVVKIIGASSGNGGYGELRLQTAFNNTLNTRLTIDKNGNVGIGSAIPTAKLDVKGVAKFSDDVFIKVRGKSFKTSDWTISNTTSGNALSISGGNSLSEKIRIKNDGSIGIGTNNPTSKLSVVGDANISGVVTATNFTKTDGTPIASTDIAINTLSSSSATGGGSATFNGSAYRFTLSEPPDTSVFQLLVSVNGVIQKPNAGSSQPSEGFAIDGNDIIFGTAPPAGSPFFIQTFKTVGISSIPPQAQVSTTSSAKSVKNVTTSTSAPTNSNGVDGDLWFTYIA